MLALAMLVVAFANPFIPAQKQQSGNSQHISIYIDNSPSMTTGELQSSKISEMRGKAASFIKALPSDSRVQVLSNDFSGRQMQFYAPSEALILVDEINDAFSSRHIDEILDRIQATREENDVDEGDIYLFSDFQAQAFDAVRSAQLIAESRAILPGIKGPEANLALDSVWFYEPVLQPGFDQTLKAKLSYTGIGNQKEIAIRLLIDEELQAVQQVSLEPGLSTEVEFVIRTENPATYSGKLELDAGIDPEFDNTLYFNFEVARAFRVMLSGSDQHLNTFENLFSDSIYDFDYTVESAIDYGELGDYDLIILDAPSKISSGFSAAIKNNLEQGRNLVLIPGNENNEDLNRLLSELGKPQIGQKYPGISASSISWSDPHFSQVFSNTSDKPALPSPNYYFDYPSAVGYPLIRLENSKALVSRLPTGNGDLILYLSSLDSSGLKRQALIVPLMLNAALYSRENHALYTLSGKPHGPKYPKPTSDQVLSIALEKGTMIPRQRQKGNQIELYELPSSIKPGSYSVNDGRERLGIISVNTEPAESRWEFLSSEELENQFTAGKPIDSKQSGIALEELIKRQYEGISLWKWFLAGAVLMLLIELILLKIWK